MVCNQFQGCLAVIQQGGPDTWYNWGGPAKVGARKSFLFTESSVVVKKKNTCQPFLKSHQQFN